MKREEPRNLQRKKRRNKRRLFSLLIFVLLLIYLPAIWNWLFSVNVEIGVIKTATIEVKVPIKGIMVRKEQILSSPGDGIVIPTVQYGDKVAAYHEVASFISADMRDMVNHYREMKLEILKRAVTKFDGSVGSEREMWESVIEKQIDKLTDFSNSGDFSSLSNVRSSIDDILEARALFMLESSNAQDILKIEKNELNQLETSINKSVTRIQAPASGVVSYFSDGFEAVLTPDTLSDITVETIDQALAKEVPIEKWITPSEVDANKGQSFGKLVTNDEAWLVFYVTQEEGSALSVAYEKMKMDQKELILDLEIDGLSDRVPVTIQNVKEVPNDLYLVTSRMDQFIELTMDKRGITGDLVRKSVSGMKVPVKSLSGLNNVDNTADIIIVEMNKAAYKRIQVVATQDSYAIIENIDITDEAKCVNVYDVYVVNPKNIEEGQVIEE